MRSVGILVVTAFVLVCTAERSRKDLDGATTMEELTQRQARERQELAEFTEKLSASAAVGEAQSVASSAALEAQAQPLTFSGPFTQVTTKTQNNLASLFAGSTFYVGIKVKIGSTIGGDILLIGSTGGSWCSGLYFYLRSHSGGMMGVGHQCNNPSAKYAAAKHIGFKPHTEYFLEFIYKAHSVTFKVNGVKKGKMLVVLEVSTVSKPSCGTSYCGQITIGKGDPRTGGSPFGSYFTNIKDVTVGPASLTGSPKPTTDLLFLGSPTMSPTMSDAKKKELKELKKELVRFDEQKAAVVAKIAALQGTVRKAASPRRTPLTNGLFHVGFENAEYWNEDLWTRLSASGVNCNPAKCANPAVCAIPNCTLVDFDQFYGGGRHNRFDCDSRAKQTSTCVPRRMRRAWPASVGLADGEDKACRVALRYRQEGKPDTGRGQILYTWFLHPATRTVFCQSNYYFNSYVIGAPTEQPKKKRLRNVDWLWMNPGFRNVGDWMVSVRGFFAFPFGRWKLENGQSTRNIVLFIFKRSVCKGSKCFNTRDSKCFETRRIFTRSRWPSAVSSSELKNAAGQITSGSSKKCSKVTLKYAMPAILKFVAAS